MTLLINICLFVLSLVSLAFEEGKKKLSLSMMAKGDLKRLFWPWVVAGGMIIPLIVVGYGAAVGVKEIAPAVWLIAVILQVIGDPVLRYGLMRTGYYPGIFPGTPSDFR